MARQQRFQWWSRQSKAPRGGRRTPTRLSRLELLENRQLLSLSVGLPDAADLHGSDSPHGMYAPVEGQPLPDFAEFDASGGRWSDDNPADGVTITYSYVNFTDGSLPGGTLPENLIAATEEALGLWAAVAPLHFVEVVDSGPAPSELFYEAGIFPDIRIGHHLIDGPSGVLAHAYFPREGAGRAGDVHFDSGENWRIGQAGGFDVLEVMLHELGHSLGLGHEPPSGETAIMNPFYGRRFNGLGTGALFDDDIAGIQELYGEGVGSVTPLQPLFVDITVDESDGNFDEGDLSLREAIEQAIAGGGIQRVSFAESMAGETFVLDSPLPVGGNLFLEGLGADQITIQAADPSESVGDGFRIFEISDSDDETTLEITVTGVTITGGDSAEHGGAIRNEERLTLENVRLVGNASQQRGGAIYSTGRVTLTESTVADNSAEDDGGGIHSLGGVTVLRSTVSSNTSGDEGGGISAEGDGTSIVVNNSTISGNMAAGSGGGIHAFDLNPSRLRVVHSTVTGNVSGNSGGGIYQYDGVLLLDHSIVAGNTDFAGAPDIDNVNFLNNPVVIARYSIVGNNQGADQELVLGNRIGTPLDPVDPLLGPLQDNGGPTETHELLDGSLALEGGNPNILNPPEFDQRGFGFDRIDGIIDIGAYESGGFALTLIVDTLLDENDGDYSEGDLSLREALERSNLAAGNDRIVFAPQLSGGTIQLSRALGELVISDSTVIDAGDLTSLLTIDGSDGDLTPLVADGDGIRLFRVDNANANTKIDVRLEGFYLTGGDVSGHGGAIHSLENLSLKNVSIEGNHATGDGGAIYQQDGSFEFVDGTLANNGAGDDGGGLFVNTEIEGQTAYVRQATFSGNTAGDEGGAIYNFDGLLRIEHSTITDNEADYGSGVVSFGDLATQTSVYSSIIADNSGLDVSISRNLGFNSFVSEGYNLIGVGNGFLAFMNNDVTEVLDAQLAPLADNGGLHRTHLPRVGSAAVDAGDPAFDVDDPDGDPLTEDALPFDQRGLARVADGDNDGTARLDLGAVERQPPEPDTDFNNDGLTGGFDFLAWQRGQGTTTGASPADGDTDADGDVDGDDLAHWESQFGDQGPVSMRVTAADPARPSTVQRTDPNTYLALAAKPVSAERMNVPPAPHAFLHDPIFASWKTHSVPTPAAPAEAIENAGRLRRTADHDRAIAELTEFRFRKFFDDV